MHCSHPQSFPISAVVRRRHLVVGGGQLVRQGRQSQPLRVKAATSSRDARASAPAIKHYRPPAGSAFPQGPQPLIASLRDLQAVGACSDFSLVQTTAVSRALYILTRPRLPLNFFTEEASLAVTYAELARPSTTTPSTTARSRGAFSVTDDTANYLTPTAILIVAFFRRSSPTCRPTTMLSGRVPALPLSGKSRLSP